MTQFQNYFGQWATPWGGFLLAALGGLFFLIIIWSLVWKGLALWQSARRGEKIWFVVFLAVNTLGILEILYLYVFRRKSKPVEK